jgi:hypothetical protein
MIVKAKTQKKRKLLDDSLPSMRRCGGQTLHPAQRVEGKRHGRPKQRDQTDVPERASISLGRICDRKQNTPFMPRRFLKR